MAFRLKQKNRCRKCNAELPDDAKFCDICGEPCASPEQRRFEMKKGIIIVVIIAVFMGARLYINIKANRILKNDSLMDVEATVTAEEYDRLNIGMKRDKVIRIIGGPGKADDYSERWPGIYYDNDKYDRYDSCVELKFNDNGELHQKREHSITDAEELEAVKQIMASSPGDIDAPLVTREQLVKVEEGMTLDEVSAVLGGNGVLSSTSSSETYYGYEKELSTYVWRCRRHGKDDYIEIGFWNNRVAWELDNIFLRGIEKK